jgi:hypothetical protein
MFTSFIMKQEKPKWDQHFNLRENHIQANRIYGKANATI